MSGDDLWWAKKATGPVRLKTAFLGNWAGSRAAGEGLIQFFHLRNTGGPGRGLTLVLSGSAIDREVLVPISASIEVRPRRKRAEVAPFVRDDAAWIVDLPDEDIRAGLVIAADVELRKKLSVKESKPAFDAIEKNHISFSIQGLRNVGEGELTTTVVAGPSEPWTQTELFRVTEAPQPPRSTDTKR